MYVMRSRSDISGAPGTSTVLFHALSLTGVMNESPACETPGTAATASSTRS